MVRKLIFVLVLSLISMWTYSQCCSMGNPFTGSSGAGLINKHHFRVAASYKYGYYQTYYAGSTRLINYGPMRYSYYHFSSFVLSYGLTHRITLENEAGYFIRKGQRYYDPKIDTLIRKGYGLSNGTFVVKYGLYVNTVKEWEVSIGAGLKYPFSTRPLSIDNVELPVELQPSTGAYGFTAQVFVKKGFSDHSMSIFLSNRFEKNFKNKFDYTYGSSNITALSVSKKLFTGCTGLAQFREEIRGADDPPANLKGSYVLVFTPQLSYAIAGRYFVSATADLPLFRYYKGKADLDNGTGGQIGSRYAIGFNFSMDI